MLAKGFFRFQYDSYDFSYQSVFKKNVINVNRLRSFCRESFKTLNKINREFMNDAFRFRRSHRTCSVRKVVLRNFGKLTGKHRSQPATLLNKEPLAQVFSCEFCKISSNTFFTESPRAVASIS